MRPAAARVFGSSCPPLTRLDGIHRTLIRCAALLALAALLLTTASAAPVARDDRFGIAHVSYPAGPRSAARYLGAAAAGASWDRWALYWTDVETSQGNFNWANVDANVDGDVANGFQVDPVLLATPGFYATTACAQSTDLPVPRIEDKEPALAVMRGEPVRTAAAACTISPPVRLSQPVFADGTDVYAAGKAINPNNPWARFVAAAVARYKDRVHVWEVWNEPDFSAFWSGSVPDYTRLLKVAYLSAKSVDPNATVTVGGMMYWEWANRSGDQAWLKAFLDQLTLDPAARGNGYYFDAIPWHWYSRSSDVYDKITSAKALLTARGVSGKRQWVNEMNAPACGEPPANVSCADPNYKGSASAQEQAAFVVQAMAYAIAVGADHSFHFQYQDDGNAEAFGLLRNDGSARPAYTAYQVAAQYFAGATTGGRFTVGNVELIVVGSASSTVTTMWARSSTAETAVVSAKGSSATLVEMDGTTSTVFPVNGVYRVPLERATDNRNFSGSANDFIVGGKPRLLVEQVGYGPPPTLVPGWDRSTMPVAPRSAPPV